MRRFIPLAFAALLTAIIAPPTSAADDDATYPVAVQWWGGSMVSIQSFANGCIAIDPIMPVDEALDRSMPSAFGLFNTGRRQTELTKLFQRISASYQPLAFGESDHFIVAYDTQRAFSDDRNFSSTATVFSSDNPPDTVAPDAIVSRAYKVNPDTSPSYIFVVEIDGVRIFHYGNPASLELTDDLIEQIGPIDAMCVPLTLGADGAARMVEAINPRIVIPILWNPKRGGAGNRALMDFLAALPDKYTIDHAIGNTVAVSAAGGPTRDHPLVIIPDDEPWTMPADLAALFDAKEAASKRSRDVFRYLRSDQLNHKPSDGTHTPRWNNEHMLSTELYFFSSIYSNLDPAITPIKLFPKQMPADYIPAHPDWAGADEAAQAMRVQDFTRRFAYLLEGMPLDQLPAGAPRFLGDLQGVFTRMEDHFNEHTANVRKKFRLEDWPD